MPSMSHQPAQGPSRNARTPIFPLTPTSTAQQGSVGSSSNFTPQQLSPNYALSGGRSTLFGQRAFPDRRPMSGIGSSMPGMSSFGMPGRGYNTQSGIAAFHSAFGGSGDAGTPPLLDLSEFPSLTNRSQGDSMLQPSPMPGKQPYDNTDHLHIEPAQHELLLSSWPLLPKPKKKPAPVMTVSFSSENNSSQTDLQNRKKSDSTAIRSFKQQVQLNKNVKVPTTESPSGQDDCKQFQGENKGPLVRNVDVSQLAPLDNTFKHPPPKMQRPPESVGFPDFSKPPPKIQGTPRRTVLPNMVQPPPKIPELPVKVVPAAESPEFDRSEWLLKPPPPPIPMPPGYHYQSKLTPSTYPSNTNSLEGIDFNVQKNVDLMDCTETLKKFSYRENTSTQSSPIMSYGKSENNCKLPLPHLTTREESNKQRNKFLKKRRTPVSSKPSPPPSIDKNNFPRLTPMVWGQEAAKRSKIYKQISRNVKKDTKVLLPELQNKDEVQLSDDTNSVHQSSVLVPHNLLTVPIEHLITFSGESILPSSNRDPRSTELSFDLVPQGLKNVLAEQVDGVTIQLNDEQFIENKLKNYSVGTSSTPPLSASSKMHLKNYNLKSSMQQKLEENKQVLKPNFQTIVIGVQDDAKAPRERAVVKTVQFPGPTNDLSLSVRDQQHDMLTAPSCRAESQCRSVDEASVSRSPKPSNEDSFFKTSELSSDEYSLPCERRASSFAARFTDVTKPSVENLQLGTSPFSEGIVEPSNSEPMFYHAASFQPSLAASFGGYQWKSLSDNGERTSINEKLESLQTESPNSPELICSYLNDYHQSSELTPTSSFEEFQTEPSNYPERVCSYFDNHDQISELTRISSVEEFVEASNLEGPQLSNEIESVGKEISSFLKETFLQNFEARIEERAPSYIGGIDWPTEEEEREEFMKQFIQSDPWSVGMVKQPTGESSEFTISSEDFPALPGTQGKDGPGQGSAGNDKSGSTQGSAHSQISDMGNGETGSSTNLDVSTGASNGSSRAPGAERQMAQERGVQTHSDGRVTNIPTSMVKDQFGIVGLLTFIRVAETEPNLVAMSLGQDLKNLGLNLNSPENIYPNFGGPFADAPCRPQDIDYHVPHEYLVNAAIRDKLPIPKLSHYKEDLLFYFFYCYPGDSVQLAAATELYNRDWRYHMEEKVWISRAPGATLLDKTSTYERGTYYFFDPQKWRKVAKEFLLEYSKLEDRPPIPQHAHMYPPPGMPGTTSVM